MSSNFRRLGIPRVLLARPGMRKPITTDQKVRSSNLFGRAILPQYSLNRQLPFLRNV
jgi:hypothetical protein